MNQLFAFLKKNFHIILFFLLQIFCFVMIYNSLHYQHFVIAKFSRTITYPVHKLWTGLEKHFKLKGENDALIEQNLQLMRELDANFIQYFDTVYTKYTVDENNKKERLFDYQKATVVYNSTNKRHNYLIIDRGREDGIREDMAVISPGGIVGVISDVSSNFSTVMSVLHPDSRISARIVPINHIGTVVWEDGNPEIVYLHDIPQHLPVQIGDSVFTSGYSNVFPRDILIGTVVETKNNTKNSFYNIKVKLTTNFNQLHTVYIIENLHREEIEELKANFKNE